MAKIAAGSALVDALVWRWEAEQARRPGERGTLAEALVAEVEAWIGAKADRGGTTLVAPCRAYVSSLRLVA